MTEDYAEIEELAIALQQESQLLRDLLANAEQATPEVSRQIRDRESDHPRAMHQSR